MQGNSYSPCMSDSINFAIKVEIRIAVMEQSGHKFNVCLEYIFEFNDSDLALYLS